MSTRGRFLPNKKPGWLYKPLELQESLSGSARPTSSQSSLGPSSTLLFKAPVGSGTKHAYLTPHKGLVFYRESDNPIGLPGNIELLQADKIRYPANLERSEVRPAFQVWQSTYLWLD